jgi:hypothetical protein
MRCPAELLLKLCRAALYRAVPSGQQFPFFCPMKKPFSAALALAITLLAASCQKDDVDFTPPAVVEPASFIGLTARHSPHVQVFEFDPTHAQTFTTAAGAHIDLQANAFVRADGSVPTGPVILQFLELYTPVEMMLANKATTGWSFYSNSIRGLESGGEFNVKVIEKNTSQALQLTTGGAFVANKLIVRSPVPDRVLTSNSVNSMTTWVPDAGGPWADSTIWVEADTILMQPGNGNPSGPRGLISVPFSAGPAGSGGFFVIANWPSRMGWLNVDVLFPRSAPRIKASVRLDGGTDGATRVFLIPTGINGCFQPILNPQTNLLEIDGIPSGTELTAVVMRVLNGKYYFGTQRAPNAQGFVYQPQLEEISEDDLVRRLKQL